MNANTNSAFIIRYFLLFIFYLSLGSSGCEVWTPNFNYYLVTILLSHAGVHDTHDLDEAKLKLAETQKNRSYEDSVLLLPFYYHAR